MYLLHLILCSFFFFFNDTATTEIYTLSLQRRSSDLRRRMPRARAWWDATRSPAAKEARAINDFSSAAKNLRTLLENAVRAHLIADVPVGLFLSSGLDSSA